MTLTMVEASLREYELLHFAFNSCRVFFTSNRAPEQEEEEEEEAGATAEI